MSDDQPDGIQGENADDNRIPSPAAAAARVVEFVKWFGDGEVWDRTPLGDPLPDPVPPLYARDLCALACAVQHGYRADEPSRCLHDPDGSAAHDRQVAERAWDEGARAAFGVGLNPYRADSLAPRHDYAPSDGGADAAGKALPAGLCYVCQQPKSAHSLIPRPAAPIGPFVDESTLPEGVHATFTRTCRDCGRTVNVIAGAEQPHECTP